MMDLADDELMDLYVRGSQAAFEVLFRRYGDRAHTYFLRRVGCEARAADLYQELFLRLHRFRAQYDRSRPFEPWFFNIARHVLVDDWRRRYRVAEVGLEEGSLLSSEPDAQERVAAQQEADRWLQLLSPEQARILVDSKVWGFEYTEIAEALAKSADAVKQTASRSRRRLRSVPDAAE